MGYQSRNLSTKKKGSIAIKVVLVLFLIFIYVASYNYVQKNDNKILLEPIKIENGKTQ
ncbi:hypothetical protein HAV_00147 [Candidatus Hepatincola sp. Av]